MFTVTITKTTIEERPMGREWKKLRDDMPALGYTPEIMEKKEVELKVYEQTVDEIDIKAVIEAVNFHVVQRRVGNQPAGPV